MLTVTKNIPVLYHTCINLADVFHLHVDALLCLTIFYCFLTGQRTRFCACALEQRLVRLPLRPTFVFSTVYR